MLSAEIRGAIVTKVTRIHDYIQIAFGDDMGISIYNPFKLIPDDADLSSLIGKEVMKVEERDEEYIKLYLADDFQLIIDIHRDTYVGPEALQLNRRNKPPIIWN